MQQRLIDFVQDHAPQRFGEYKLERVFVNGWDVPEPFDPAYPVDATCGAIQETMINAHGFLPPWEKLLLNVGWRRVEFNPDSSVSRSIKQGTRSHESFPRIASDFEEPERIIFHPPRSHLPIRSICTNTLYDNALKARKRAPNCMTFEYRYRTTLDWYRDLKSENRAYNHINVDTWDMIFADLDLNKGKKSRE
jgi:hypothetical protein